MKVLFTKSRSAQRGFSILEMLLATVILLVGLVAVAQLVPASILLNYRNRTDSSALVYAQRELDFMVAQPLTSSSFTDPLGVYCPSGNTCNLGNPATPNTLVGSPVSVTYSSNSAGQNFGQTAIDFIQSTVANYNFLYQDPTDPGGTTYDVRWAVIITGNSGIVYSKRIILGIRQVNGNGYFQPITLDTTVSK
jgi:prepilin-type N-terminal cleavage/methylation domain-containing protein